MTDIDKKIARLAEYLERATPEPWTTTHPNYFTPEDLFLVADMRNYLPDLIAELKNREDTILGMKAALRQVDCERNAANARAKKAEAERNVLAETLANMCCKVFSTAGEGRWWFVKDWLEWAEQEAAKNIGEENGS